MYVFKHPYSYNTKCFDCSPTRARATSQSRP